MEAQDLIYLVSCAVNGVTPDAARIARMDLNAIYKLARRHMLAATVSPALKAAGIQDRRFAKALEHSALKSSTMDMEMDALFAALSEAGIWHMPLKGTVLQHLYPIYGMRQMSDHDILVDADRMEDVKAIMEGLGFHKDHDTSCHDSYFKEPVSNFEMHRRLFSPGFQTLLAYYKDIHSRMLGDGYEKHLSPEDFYLYVIAHEYKHYAVNGTGLRSLLDAYVILKKKALDLTYVEAEAEKMGIAEFEAQNRSLSLRLFSDEALTAKDQEMLDYILSSGVYGNLSNGVENGIRKSGGSKLRYMLDRFCVPVSEKNPSYFGFAAAYPFFYRHKILLPLLPFYRTFRSIKAGRFKSEAKVLRNAKV